MKTLTYQQKKWAMTSALMMVLGFNVSFNSHTNGIAAMDLSSLGPENSNNNEVVVGQIATTIGVANIKYMKNGDNTTTALVPRKNTEGTAYCETCGYDSYRLNIDLDKFKNDIQAVNVALLQRTVELQKEEAAKNVVTKKSTDKAADKSVKEDVADEELSDREKNKIFTQQKLDRLAKECKWEEDEQVKCLSEGVSDILKTEKWADKIDKSMIEKFIKTKIFNQAKSDLDKLSEKLNVGKRYMLRFGNNYPNPTNPFDVKLIQDYQAAGEANGILEADNKRTEILNSFARFTEVTPSSFDSTRSYYVENQRQLLVDEAYKIQQLELDLPKHLNDYSYSTNIIQRKIFLNELKQDMGKIGSNSIDIAYQQENIDPTRRDVYRKFFQSMALEPIALPNGTVFDPTKEIATMNQAPGYAQTTVMQFPSSIADRFNTNRGFTAAPAVTIQSINQQIGTPAGILNNNYQPQYQPQQQFQQNFEARTGRGF